MKSDDLVLMLKVVEPEQLREFVAACSTILPQIDSKSAYASFPQPLISAYWKK